MVDKPSSIPPAPEQHSWAEARFYLPEERKEFLVGLISDINALLGKFRAYENQGQFNLSTDREGNIEALLHEARTYVLSRMERPVSDTLLRGVNGYRSQMKLDELTWPDVQDLYFCKDPDILNRELEAVESSLGQSNVAEVVSELESILRYAEQGLSKLGGNSADALRRVYDDGYDVDKDSAWHNVQFGPTETSLMAQTLKMLMSRLDKTVDEIVIDDRGCGTGRSLKQYIQLLSAGLDIDGKREFQRVDNATLDKAIRNYHGIDIYPPFVERTRQVVRSVVESDAPPPNLENIREGNFHALPLEQPHFFQEGKVDLIICFMRTALYNLTESQTATFLERAAYDLTPGTKDRLGGMMLIDTAMMRKASPEALNDPRNRAQLDDLKNLYSQLFIAYAERFQELMPEGVDLKNMPRRPIYDNLTRHGYLFREVISPEFIRHIIAKYHIDLEVQETRRLITDYTADNDDKRLDAVKLGRAWILENGMEERYRSEINERISSGVVDPAELLKIDLSEKSGEDVVELLLDYVAYHMVRGFGCEYIVLQRPQLKAEDIALDNSDTPDVFVDVESPAEDV